MRAVNRSAIAIPRSIALAIVVAVAIGLAGGREGAARATTLDADTPRLDIEASAPFAGDANRLRALDPARLRTLMTLVGLRDPGDPIHVVLAAEDHPLARDVPAGVAGYAVSQHDLAVLLPERLPRYPYDSLEVVLLHEVTHLLAARATGGHPLPRWWNEGLAMVASREWSLEDRSRVLLGAVSGVADTAALEASFDGGTQQTAAAYAISGALVHHLVQRHGAALVATTLARVSAGDDFETAFESAAGVPLARDVEGFWRRYLFWYRWLPFLTSGAALWASVTALAILAGVRRRRRDAEIRRRWDEEERRAELAREARETVN